MFNDFISPSLYFPISDLLSSPPFPIAEYDYKNGTITLNNNGVDREKLLGLLKTNNRNTKETNKMEAKKCDRCGKLYEKKFDKNDIQCVFKYEEPFFTGEEKNYSKEYIEDKKTHDVYIKRGNGDYIDMCPDCRKAFKTWFESADKEGKKNV